MKKINKLRKYDKYKLIKDNDEYEDEQQAICSSSIFNTIDSKNDLNEMKFLRDDTQQGETKRTNRKNLMKQIQITNNKELFKTNKKVKQVAQLEVNDNEEKEDDEEQDNQTKNDLIYKDKLDLENDLELLDSSDSLDQTIFNLIKSANPKLFKNSKNNQENGSLSPHQLEKKLNHLQDQLTNDNNSSIKFDYDNALR